MADVAGKCKIQFPPLPTRINTIPRSAHQMDAEDGRATGPLFGFALCEFGRLLQALLDGHSASRTGRYSILEKPMP